MVDNYYYRQDRESGAKPVLTKIIAATVIIKESQTWKKRSMAAESAATGRIVDGLNRWPPVRKIWRVMTIKIDPFWGHGLLSEPGGGLGPWAAQAPASLPAANRRLDASASAPITNDTRRGSTLKKTKQKNSLFVAQKFALLAVFFNLGSFDDFFEIVW